MQTRRHILITGGSRGLGLALAELFIQRGERVTIVARDPAPLADAARRLGVLTIAADVGDPDAPASIAGRAAAEHGPIDVLVLAASTLGPVPLRTLLDTDDGDFERALAVNLAGPFRLTRTIGGAMVVRDRGTIVFVSSDAAVEAYPRWGAYGATKAAADHLAKILAAELADTHVRVFAFDPGEMNTKMHADAIPDADPSTLTDPHDVATRLARLIDDPPTGVRV